jgi:hypothetical protein
LLVVIDSVVGNTADLRVRRRAAECLRVDDLSSCAFDEIRSAESHERGALDHQNDIGQRRQIGASRNTLSHHGRDLRNMEVAAHDRVVIKNPRGAVLSGEYSALIRQIHSRGVDEVNDRNSAAHGDLLRAQNLPDGFRPPGSGLHCRVVGNDDRFPSMHADDGGDDPRRRGLPLILIVGDEHPDFEHARVRIPQELHPLARGKLALLMQLLELLLSARFAQLRFELAHFRTQLPEAVGPGRRHYASCFSRA